MLWLSYKAEVNEINKNVNQIALAIINNYNNNNNTNKNIQT